MCLDKFLSTDSFHDNLLIGIEICGEQILKLIVCEDGFVNKRFLYFFDVIECRFCDFSLGNIILDIEIITAESLDLRDKNDLFFLLNIESYQQGQHVKAGEKVGEVGNTFLSLIFVDFNINTISKWSIILFIAFLLMILYEIYWIKYFRSNKTMNDMYSSILGVPVAGATLPVLAFLLLGIYGKNILLIISTIILGIGHIGIHLNHKKEIE